MTIYAVILMSVMATATIVSILFCRQIETENKRLRRMVDRTRRLRTRALNQRDEASIRVKAFEARSGELINERNEAVQALHWRTLGSDEVCGTWIRPAFGGGIVKAGDA